MKFTLTNRRKWILGTGAALLLTATPSFALFGIGDIVFDPTSYASLVSQLTTIESQYNLLKNNITHFSAKQLWQTELHSLENVNVANMFGETAGVKIALNSNNPSASLTGWQTATVPMKTNTSTYLAGQQLGSSRMSQLAMIETSDAVSPDCLTAVGQYRSGRSTDLTANSSLRSSQFDNSDSTNAEVQQLNLINASEGQRMSEMQSQGSLQVCLAGQMTVANMERRNAAVEDLNAASTIQQTRSTNDVSAANEGSTWTTYLP
jgi:type IV secretion system protein TrbJ